MPSVIDTLEDWFTRRPEQEPPAWLRWIPAFPPRDQAITTPLSRQSYVKHAFNFSLFPNLLMILCQVVVFFVLYYQFHNEPAAMAAIGRLFRKEIVIPLVFSLLFFTGLSFAILWPRYYFWNRRAGRVKEEGPNSVEPVKDDPRVWPPPPKFPNNR